MADSEGPSSDANDSSPSLPPVAKPLAPAPRVNPPNINAAKEAPPTAGGPPGFTDFLEWMRNQVTPDAAPGTAAQRGLIPKEKKKFQRRDADTKSDPTADASPAASESATKEVSAPSAKTPVPDPSTPVAKPLLVDAPVPVSMPKAGAEAPLPAKGLAVVPEPPTRVRRQQVPLKRNAWFGLVLQAAMLVLLIGSFLLGRMSVSKVVTAPTAPAAPEVVNSEGKTTTKLLSDANASLIDQAMVAEQDLKFDKAEELLKQVKASGQHVYGLTFQLAQLALFQRDYHKAMPLLNASIAENEKLDESYNLRATVVGQTGLIRATAMNDYDTATKIEPFGARNFYFWGEALRRVGKDQAAIARLKQAIDRLREPELESVYRLKLRLALLEAGLEKEFADELAKQMAMPNPEMDWLITAAAVEINRGQFAAAAGYLERASTRGDAETFASRLRDYYLYQFKDNKELARFYTKAPAAKPTLPESAPATSPGPDASSPPAIGLDVPNLPPPASPGATVAH